MLNTVKRAVAEAWGFFFQPSQQIPKKTGLLDTLKSATPQALAAIAAEKMLRKTDKVFILFPMGSQFDHLIYMLIAKLGLYCLVADPAKVTANDIRKVQPAGIIYSGGPSSMVDEPPPFDPEIFDLGIPTLGICLGAQMIAHHVGVKVSRGRSEFSRHAMQVFSAGELFHGCALSTSVLHSHGDEIELDEDRLEILGSTGEGKVSAFRSRARPYLYGTQFHVEVTDTEEGPKMLENFCFRICGATEEDRFQAVNVAERKIEKLRVKLAGGKKAILGLSGGSDSSVVDELLQRAVNREPGRIRRVYIKGIDRPDDEAFVIKYFGDQPGTELKIIDATEWFLEALCWRKMKFRRKVKRIMLFLLGLGPRVPVTMKSKRLAVREVYKAILEAEAEDFGADFIAQGTLYTDISESGGGYASGAKKAVIKIHHNVNLGFSLPELTPLADCVKDNARDIGRAIGVPEELLTRHPFPGPGLVVRIEGEITPEKLAMTRKLDGIYIEELRRFGLYEKVWQAGVNVTLSEHTFTKGDGNGTGIVVMYWAVWSVNGFTATAAELPDEFHRTISRRFGNEVPGIGAVTERKSNKPFTTIEMG